MFVKPVKLPYYVAQYEAFARRVQPGATQDSVEEQFKNYRAGFHGEKSLIPYLTALPDKDYYMIHDLRLSNRVHDFQIDYLLLHPQSIVILEVKNIAGILSLDFLTHTLTRKFNDKIETFQDPLVQTEKLKQQLQDWLYANFYSLPEIPINDLVVFSSPSTYINFLNMHEAQNRRIIRGPQVTRKITGISRPYRQAKPLLSAKNLRTIANRLVAAHRPKTIDLISDGTLLPEDIVRGVRCPNCGRIPMLRTNHSWSCPSCRKNSQTAHIDSLRDYQLIYGPKITNAQCRDFLGLESESTARYFLQSASIKQEGANRNRTYFLNLSEK
ncbi:MAG: nuclease-related domain-containing protein [Sporolactobacillus sp.]